uniref:Uncharacterized protein n=1 Tax=Rhodosorus marinus TaxID=101924 RepID=A0A7S0BPR5_9RHOD|mmetsp:Transcript_3217/g.4626  ORF Transcript_3217/g.4626 Transcript_3217/m.4626 type:complete len:141 (+) Transcript_3217:100-522(+)
MYWSDDSDYFSRMDSDDGSLIDSEEEQYLLTEKMLQEELWLWKAYEKDGQLELQDPKEREALNQLWEASEDNGVEDCGQGETIRKSDSVRTKRPGFWRLNKNALLFGTSGAIFLGPPGAVVGTMYGIHRDKQKQCLKTYE